MKNTNYSIDVIIPAYNASKYIAETIQSVLVQTLLPRRIIVVDDGSTDDTVEIVKKFNCELIEIISIPKGGTSRARNTGIHASKADYIAFLDADDLWEPEKLAAQVEALAINPKMKAVYSYAQMFDEYGNLTNKAYSYKNIPYPPGRVAEKILFESMNISGSASSVMVEANILKSTGLFDENIRFGEDIDLWLRICKFTDYALVAKNHIKIRVHPSSSTRSLPWKTKKQMIADHFFLMNKYSDDYKLPKKALGFSIKNLIKPFAHRPHRIFEFYTFSKHLEQKIAPGYFKQFKQVLVDNSPTKTLLLEFFWGLVRFIKKIRVIDRLKLLFSKGTMSFAKSEHQ